MDLVEEGRNTFSSSRSDFGSAGFSAGGIQAISEPVTVPLVFMGILALSLSGWKSRKRVA